MKVTSVGALFAVASASIAAVGEARLGRDLLATTTKDDDIEPSQLFMIVCLAIGAFVMLVALVACLIVLKRYSGAATASAQGPAYANGVGVVSVGGPQYGQPMMMQQPGMYGGGMKMKGGKMKGGKMKGGYGHKGPSKFT